VEASEDTPLQLPLCVYFQRREQEKKSTTPYYKRTIETATPKLQELLFPLDLRGVARIWSRKDMEPQGYGAARIWSRKDMEPHGYIAHCQ